MKRLLLRWLSVGVAVLLCNSAAFAAQQTQYRLQVAPARVAPPMQIRPMPGSTPMMIQRSAPIVRQTPPPPPRPTYVQPVPGQPSAGFYDPTYAAQIGKQHLGVDYPAKAGTQVVAPVTGQVRGYYPQQPAYNSFVVVQPNGTTTQQVLGHVNCPTCYSGEPITQGRTFGAAVAPNPVEGAHVHWGADYQGIPLTPQGGYGWGQGPATSTPAQAQSRGWFDPTRGP